MAQKIKIAITHGDLNGIGYEVLFKAFENDEIFDLFTPIVYGSVAAAEQHKAQLGSEVRWQVISAASEARDSRLNFIDVAPEEQVTVTFGQPSAVAGRLAHMALDYALIDVRTGAADVLVTLPINKASIQSKDFAFPGHTEYLADRCEGEAQMILMNERMRIALATTHVPVSQVAQHISAERIEAQLRALHHSLQRDFCVTLPRIAVLGLNPHCGDTGLIGTEERDVIAPLINRLNANSLPVFGPYSADGFFGAAHYRHFDAILAMYHDQGLAPFKTLAMDDGVNFTAGLDIVRTSPDHGTAYDIAGKNLASPTSLLQALYAAIDIYRCRRNYDEITANPLPITPRERRDDRRWSV